MNEFIEQMSDCPYCANRLLLPGVNSLADKHADLLNEWDYLNNYLLLQPTEVRDTSHSIVWWICKKDSSHHYPMSISQRLEILYRNRESCPYCRGHRVKLRHFM
jgi:hypothetical protein